MTRQVGRLGVLRRIEGDVISGDGGAITLSGKGTGFTGFDVNIQGTNETIPGGGALRTRDTGHKTGTVSYGVDHAGAAKTLWDKHGHRATYLFQEEGSGDVERYHGFDSVTVSFTEAGAVAYTVEVTLYRDVS